ncbi:hypothetical protein AYO20_11653 [Fonsecaea nubica]|uniref:Uncharacterized protein n=1 Tax=Fonsecaea nubica TaxID=856822 RepID=A0A178BP16_9EURO|nr:hypothetical protein AYO20_11653 [Fonsecaea nubica]OAL19398.1 hypothetical protein AYO20_11653 [Fonsecaea nubica]
MASSNFRTRPAASVGREQWFSWNGGKAHCLRCTSSFVNPSGPAVGASTVSPLKPFYDEHFRGKAIPIAFQGGPLSLPECIIQSPSAVPFVWPITVPILNLGVSPDPRLSIPPAPSTIGSETTR